MRPRIAFRMSTCIRSVDSWPSGFLRSLRLRHARLANDCSGRSEHQPAPSAALISPRWRHPMYTLTRGWGGHLMYIVDENNGTRAECLQVLRKLDLFYSIPSHFFCIRLNVFCVRFVTDSSVAVSVAIFLFMVPIRPPNYLCFRRKSGRCLPNDILLSSDLLQLREDINSLVHSVPRMGRYFSSDLSE